MEGHPWTNGSFHTPQSELPLVRDAVHTVIEAGALLSLRRSVLKHQLPATWANSQLLQVTSFCSLMKLDAPNHPVTDRGGDLTPKETFAFKVASILDTVCTIVKLNFKIIPKGLYFSGGNEAFKH